MIISASVGKGGANRRRDTVIIQHLLNDFRSRSRLELLKVDGIAGPKTCAAIEHFQRESGLRAVDGRIDVKGKTLETLVKTLLDGLANQEFYLPLLPGQNNGLQPQPILFAEIESLLQQLAD